MTRWLRSRAVAEDGIALVLAVVFVALLTVMTVSIIGYTSASSRDSSLKESGQKAYALAEAGLNQALAQLASDYYDSSGTAVNSSTVFAKSWFTGVPSSQQSPTSTAACTSTSTCMSWSVASCSFYTAVTGCTTLPGSPGLTQGTVTLSGTGTAPNPTGGTALTRTVTRSIDVTQPSQLVPPPIYWREIYAGMPPSGGCDLSLGQSVTITAPLYVAGDLCMTSSAQVYGSSSDVKVFGWAWAKQQATIGSSSGSPARVNTISVAGGCASGVTQPTMSSGCTINQTGGAFWDNNPTSSHAASAPTPDPLPSIDWSFWQSKQANSSPAPTCTNGQSLTSAIVTPIFSLFPIGSYSCTTAYGSINYTYNTAGTSTLQVSGNIYFPGNVSLTTSGPVRYSGIASLYIAGTMTAANNSVLCVAVVSGDCDFANATNTGSANYWDTAATVLILQSSGAMTAANLHFQGGMYSATAITLTGGQGMTQGPLVSSGPITVGQQLNGSFPSFPLIQAGTLGTPPPPFNLTAPYGGSY
jgi:Tfp pilus assembly protein PilX